jgi:hypothetical protein
MRTGAVEALVSRASDNSHSAFGAEKMAQFYTDLLLVDGSCLRASGMIVIGKVRGTARTACRSTPTR